MKWSVFTAVGTVLFLVFLIITLHIETSKKQLGIVHFQSVKVFKKSRLSIWSELRN